jgi:hypothetical protein
MAAMFDWGNPTTNCNTDVASIGCLEPLLKNVIYSLVTLAGLALFLMLLIGGFNYLLAGGDQKKLEKAKGTLTAAVIGLVIIVLAFLIIKTISVITGVSSLTTFQVIINNSK